MVRLGDICRFQSGGTPRKSNPEFFGGDIPWITTVALNGGKIDGRDAVDWITDIAIRKSATKVILRDSILVGTRVGIGKVAINSVPMATNQDVIALTGIDTTIWDKNFLCKFIQSKSDFLISQSRGATIRGIKIETLSCIQVPNIPICEQRRIAAVLDKVSDLIAKRRQQLEKLDELVKARFVEMFGDPLGKSKYARERIAQLGGVGTGNTPSMRVAKYYASDDIPFVKPSDMLENGVAIIADGTAFIAEAARTVARIVPAASVLVTCIGTIGKVGITSCECACNQQINYVTPRDDINVIYLAHCLSHCKQLLVEMSNAPVVPIINKSQFSAIEIPVPPLEQQKQFGSFFEQTGKVKSIISRDLEKLEILKKSLMQRYFE